MDWGDLLTGLGLAAVIEGLAIALAPRRLEDALRLLAEIPLESRRTLGLAVVALGLVVVWIARA